MSPKTKVAGFRDSKLSVGTTCGKLILLAMETPQRDRARRRRPKSAACQRGRRITPRGRLRRRNSARSQRLAFGAMVALARRAREGGEGRLARGPSRLTITLGDRNFIACAI
jgi:hypothetical protein